MNILMLGNGFDLHHNLPTDYINFIHTFDYLHEYYLDSIPANLDMVFRDIRLQKIDSKITKSYEKYADLYKLLSISQDEHKKIIELKDNYWFKYFLKCCPEPLTWIDFEKEIYSVIEAFFCFFNEVDYKDERNLKFILPNSIQHRYQLLSFDFFFDKIEGEYKKRGDKSYVVYEINKFYKKQNPEGSGIFVINEDQIVDYLYKQLEELSNGLKLYLKIFVDNLIKLDSFVEAAKEREMFKSTERVVTFNYTNIFEALYNYGDCIHIHGNINNEIILGVNPTDYDEMYKMDTRFIRFKKYYQRIINKTDKPYNALKKELNRVVLNRYDSEKNILTVFGHSLDKTDEDIIKDLFNLSDKIFIYYYDDLALTSIVKNLISIYGKSQFDELRYEKDIDFLPIE